MAFKEEDNNAGPSSHNRDVRRSSTAPNSTFSVSTKKTEPAKTHPSKDQDDPCTSPLRTSLDNPSEPRVVEELSFQDAPSVQPTKLKSITVIATLAGMSFLNTMGSGILISALPRIAQDVNLAEGFLLWPASVYALAAGCLLLIAGAVADVVGAKLVWITGSYVYVVFTVAVGFAKTGAQLIVFRTFLGIAVSMCLPTAVGLITRTFPRGQWRNVAFAANGMGQPLGYSLGLILGGIFTDTVGWRWAYYMSATINVGLASAAIWVLPSVYIPSPKKWTRRLLEDIDWLGACVLSVALGILLYVLATTTSSYKNLSDTENIVLLTVSLILLCAFPVWMHFQVKHGKPAIIPNKLWRNGAFTTTCVAVFFCWASLNAIEYFTTL
jgi:MFS family permease